jgi:hypothetical protein
MSDPREARRATGGGLFAALFKFCLRAGAQRRLSANRSLADGQGLLACDFLGRQRDALRHGRIWGRRGRGSATGRCRARRSRGRQGRRGRQCRASRWSFRGIRGGTREGRGHGRACRRGFAAAAAADERTARKRNDQPCGQPWQDDLSLLKRRPPSHTRARFASVRPQTVQMPNACGARERPGPGRSAARGAPGSPSPRVGPSSARSAL